MKNRKRPSRKNVRFKPGIFIFTLGLLGSIALGGFGRYWLETQDLDQRVRAILSTNSNFPVQVEGVRFQFRRGWLPALALAAESLTAADQTCKDRNLVARGIFVPVAILPLLQGRVTARRMAIDSLVATLPSRCQARRRDGRPEGGTPSMPSQSRDVPSQKNFEDPTPAQVVSENRTTEGLSKTLIVPQKLFAFYDEVLKNSPLPRLDVRDLQLLVVDNDVTEYQIHGRVGVRRLEESASFNLQIYEAWIFGQELPVNRGQLKFEVSQERLAIHME